MQGIQYAQFLTEIVSVRAGAELSGVQYGGVCSYVSEIGTSNDLKAISTRPAHCGLLLSYLR